MALQTFKCCLAVVDENSIRSLTVLKNNGSFLKLINTPHTFQRMKEAFEFINAILKQNNLKANTVDEFDSKLYTNIIFVNNDFPESQHRFYNKF